ncbi:MAG: hypothetical protein M3237_08970 [Actinomycetota bacterium]|nr:hypothetical protein [Actinomycetota bacterium]
MTSMRASGPARALVVVPIWLVSAGCGNDEKSTVWEREGQPADPDVVESYRGSDHCDHEEVTFLRVSWPIGTTGGQPRMYVRDPEGVLDHLTVSSFQQDAGLPDEARSSGYSSPVGALWFAPADEDSVAYLVSNEGDQVEAWPRTTSLVGCD